MDPRPDQLTILVVDDDPDMRRLLGDIFRRYEHQVVLAETAEEALELLPFWTFQLACIDHQLPGMNGIILAEYLRRNNPDMTIALVTGSGDQRLARRSENMSISYIAKPFDVDDILSLVDDCLAAATTRQEQRRAQRDPDFAPQFEPFADDLSQAWDMPGVSQRIADRLVQPLRRSMFSLRSVGRYNERDRVLVLCGLLTARILGIDLPRSSDGLTPYEEYDLIMLEHGRRTEFGTTKPDES